MTFDDLELELRRLPGVFAVGSTEHDDLVVVELQVGPDACDEIAREATTIVNRHLAAEGRQLPWRWCVGVTARRNRRRRGCGSST